MQAILAVALSALLALTACKDATAPGKDTAAPVAKAKTADVEAIAAQGKGFSVGSTMSARVVYVFFDPQCPHCAVLWNSAKPLKAQARFVWLPVAVMNGNSLPQGAALLAAPDPVAAMEQHEASLLDKRGGILPVGENPNQKTAVTANTKLLDSFGIGSIPTLVMKDGDAVKVQEGAMPTDVLARWIGTTK